MRENDEGEGGGVAYHNGGDDGEKKKKENTAATQRSIRRFLLVGGLLLALAVVALGAPRLSAGRTSSGRMPSPVAAASASRATALSKALKACRRLHNKKRRARCIARARQMAARRHAAAQPQPSSSPSASSPTAATVTTAPPATGHTEYIDGPICALGGTSLPCPCPPGTAEAGNGEPSVPAGDGWVAIEIYPEQGGRPTSCPGIVLTVDDASGALVARASNVPVGATMSFALEPGSYTGATIVDRSPSVDTSAAFRIVAGERTMLTLEVPPS